MLSKPVNRRSALAAMGLAGGAAALAACTGGTGATTAPSASAAPPASSGAPASASVSPDNMDLFKEQFGVENFVYDIYANNEVLLAKLAAGGGGYDIAAPTAEYV